MEPKEHIERIRRDGGLMADAAARGGPDVQVPTCPGWTMRDLVIHTGGVHRWAATHVRERLAAPIDVDRPEDAAGPLPGDGELVGWFRDGYAGLADTLERADPAADFFAYFPAPSPLAFWARRMAHETGMHRADAEAALGAVTPFPAEVAVDGIDELLLAFLARPRRRLRSAEPRALHLRAADTGASWLVRIGPEAPAISRDDGAEGAEGADTTVSGTASDLFLLVWNRRHAEGDGIEVRGDAGLLTLWRDAVRIRWA